jgi:energy-coupling factor transporter ATP-binding protein EcfA2
MIYRLEIENFYCIRDSQILDLTVPRMTPDNPERFAPISKGSDLRAPKVVAVFGANGSGKSTVLKALAFLGWFLKDSFQHTAPGLPCERFNDEESAGRPVRLAVEFGAMMELTKTAVARAAEGHAVPRGLYRYELELGTKDGVVKSVNKEVLRRKPEGRGKWLRVFEREAGRKLLGSSVFSLSGYARIIDKIRDDASVAATLAIFEHEPSQVLVAAASSIFSNILLDKTELSDTDVIRYLFERPGAVTELNKELQRIDVGIQEMKIIPTPSGPAPLFKHEGLLVDMPWNLESHGTRSFIRMFPWLLAPLSRGGIAIIDELDISIHPLILPEIVRWYYDPKRNAHDAQLWMTCHSVSLMDDLMKEQIVLCEKDRLGRSVIYTLMDMKAIRRSDNLYKKYMGGVYGAVPHIG